MDITTKIDKFLNEAAPKNKKLADVIKKISNFTEKVLSAEFSSSGMSPNQLAAWGYFQSSKDAQQAEKKIADFIEPLDLKSLGITYELKWYEDADEDNNPGHPYVTSFKIKFPIKPINSKRNPSFYD